MTRIAALASLLLITLAACGPSDEEGLTACPTGQTVCGTSCCTGEQQCNAATNTCEAKCTPSCRSRACGSDGCGGTCGTCDSGFLCQEETGVCYQCKPSCDGKTCGSDGCGGTCGTCATGLTCQGGTCGACQPQCTGKSCGPDGCGGQCGTCAGGACDPSGKCVECMSETDCASSVNGKKCSPDRRCVACLTNTDCKSDGTIQCDTSTNRCQVACTNDGECMGTPGAPRCDTSKNECVACLSGNDCGGATPACDPGTRSCVTCVDDEGCVSSGRGNRCLNKQQCVQCTSSADCGGGACNPVTHTCGECASDTDCSGNATRKYCDSASSTCVGCKIDANCGGSTPACHPTLKSCVPCTGDAHCAGQRCQPSTNTCVQCLSNTDCPGGTCDNGQCVTSTAGGDTCAGPATLNLSSGTVTVNGDLAAANHDISGSCGGSGRDVVYKFTLASTKDLTVTVQAVTGSMQPVVYLASSCSGTGEVACAGSGGGSSATFTRKGVAAGTYHLWVDSTAGFPQGQFSLTVTAAEPPPPVSGDTCANPIPIAFNAQGNATVTGSLTGANADYISQSCNSSSGSEVVYRFTTQYAGNFAASVISHNSSFRPTLSLWSTCPAGSFLDEPRCQTATSSSSSAGVTYGSMPAGTWYLVVDSANAATGDFDLQVSVPTTPPATGGERCSEAAPITLVNGVGTVSGTTVGKAHDGTSSVCSHASSPDLVYSFVNPVKQAVQINLKNHTPTFKPAIYMQTTCGSTSAQVGCNRMSTAGNDLLLLLDDVPAGTIYLWVDSYTGNTTTPVASTTGSFDLTVRAGVPTTGAGGESCSSVKHVTLTEGVAIGKSTLTSSNFDDNAATCASGGKDVVYSLDVPSGVASFHAYVEPRGTGWDPAVHVRRGSSCATATSVECNATPGDFFSSGYGYVELANPTAGRYYVWVEGADSTETGEYYLELWAK